MIALWWTVAAGVGIHLVFTRLAFGRRELIGNGAHTPDRARGRLILAAFETVRWRELVAACAVVALGSFLAAWVVFGGLLPSAVAAIVAASIPPLASRQRRARTRAVAQDAWPRMIEEIRVLVTNAGLSIPQAVFTAGRRAPAELAPAFDLAHREWLMTTDFGRAVAVLKDEMAHPTADATCETLLTAHAVGGVDLDSRLRALADDRLADVQARKDARAKQAGARFARAFVLAVPVGMALVGLSIGRGRDAYEGAIGQLLVTLGLVLIAVCWWWAGRIMRLPDEQRVFAR